MRQVAKERMNCVRAFDECLEVKKELDTEAGRPRERSAQLMCALLGCVRLQEARDSNGKKIEAVRQKLLKVRQKTQKLFMKFEQLREQGIRQLDTVRTRVSRLVEWP
jgi:hypothetical protein